MSDGGIIPGSQTASSDALYKVGLTQQAGENALTSILENSFQGAEQSLSRQADIENRIISAAANYKQAEIENWYKTQTIGLDYQKLHQAADQFKVTSGIEQQKADQQGVYWQGMVDARNLASNNRLLSSTLATYARAPQAQLTQVNSTLKGIAAQINQVNAQLPQLAQNPSGDLTAYNAAKTKLNQLNSQFQQAQSLSNNLTQKLGAFQTAYTMSNGGSHPNDVISAIREHLTPDQLDEMQRSGVIPTTNQSLTYNPNLGQVYGNQQPGGTTPIDPNILGGGLLNQDGYDPYNPDSKTLKSANQGGNVDSQANELENGLDAKDFNLNNEINKVTKDLNSVGYDGGGNPIDAPLPTDPTASVPPQPANNITPSSQGLSWDEGSALIAAQENNRKAVKSEIPYNGAAIVANMNPEGKAKAALVRNQAAVDFYKANTSAALEAITKEPNKITLESAKKAAENHIVYGGDFNDLNSNFLSDYNSKLLEYDKKFGIPTDGTTYTPPEISKPTWMLQEMNKIAQAKYLQPTVKAAEKSGPTPAINPDGTLPNSVKPVMSSWNPRPTSVDDLGNLVVPPAYDETTPQELMKRKQQDFENTVNTEFNNKFTSPESGFDKEKFIDWASNPENLPSHKLGVEETTVDATPDGGGLVVSHRNAKDINKERAQAILDIIDQSGNDSSKEDGQDDTPLESARKFYLKVKS